MRYSFITGLFMSIMAILSPNMGLGQGKDTLELTTQDITRVPTFNAGYATLFGIGLDMTMEQVRTIVSHHRNLKLEQDKFDARRMYLYDMSGDSGKVALAYLKWPKYGTKLMEIDIFSSVSKYMQGLSCSLLTGACMDTTSELYQNFLGKPAAETVTLDIPSIGVKTTKYYYSNPRMIIEKNEANGKVTYSLVIYKL